MNNKQLLFVDEIEDFKEVQVSYPSFTISSPPKYILEDIVKKYLRIQEENKLLENKFYENLEKLILKNNVFNLGFFSIKLNKNKKSDAKSSYWLQVKYKGYNLTNHFKNFKYNNWLKPLADDSDGLKDYIDFQLRMSIDKIKHTKNIEKIEKRIIMKEQQDLMNLIPVDFVLTKKKVNKI